jgi:DNA polymerase V
VDCNNFYASCEKLFRPDLKDTPVVVLSNNDGCVVARSREAKSLGIKMFCTTDNVTCLLQS